MKFSFERALPTIIKQLKRLFIWVVVAWLIYVLRDFFALIFLTFLLVVFTLPAVNYLQRNTRLPRLLIIVGIYLLILTALGGFVAYAVPRLLEEAQSAAREMPRIEARVIGLKDELTNRFPSVAPLLGPAFEPEQIRATLASRLEGFDQAALRIGGTVFAAIVTILFSLLFSFLIVVDLSQLGAEMRNLSRSRLREFYKETVGPLVSFATVIANAFRAQAVIALVNTVLTLCGLLVLGVPKVMLLSLIVFFFSFVPVLGVFISTIPAVLVALNTHGVDRAMAVVAMVIIVHALEAYVLNPLIYGRHMKLNPVIVLIVLYVGHHLFGMWGLLLGVPVFTYFAYYVFKIPHTGEPDSDKAPDVLAGPAEPAATPPPTASA